MILEKLKNLERDKLFLSWLDSQNIIGIELKDEDCICSIIGDFEKWVSEDNSWNLESNFFKMLNI